MSQSDAGPPYATDVRFLEERFVIELEDGRAVAVPISWFPRLDEATAEEREHWRLIGKGDGVHWPMLDEDISVCSVLAPENTVG